MYHCCFDRKSVFWLNRLASDREEILKFYLNAMIAKCDEQRNASTILVLSVRAETRSTNCKRKSSRRIVSSKFDRWSSVYGLYDSYLDLRLVSFICKHREIPKSKNVGPYIERRIESKQPSTRLAVRYVLRSSANLTTWRCIGQSVQNSAVFMLC